MKKVMENTAIVLGCISIFAVMLTVTIVFAKDTNNIQRKSYYVEMASANDFIEKDLDLVTSLDKKVETYKDSDEYTLEIQKGNVVQINLKDGSKSSVYSKGDAKYLTEVNYYYYDSKYIFVISEKGDLYVNVYKSGESKVKFRKIATNSKISSMKIVEKNQKFYAYPSVEVYGLDKDENLELIKF